MDIIKIKSGLPRTEYAASWNISIGRAVWNEPEKIDTIRNWLIDNEERIKNEYLPLNDGGTGLGDSSVTSRYGRYHLFQFADELPELNDLLKFLRLSWMQFVSKDFTSCLELNFVCWFNIVYENEKIKEHSHGCGLDGYLSGNMHLDNYSTHTYYRSPFNFQQSIPIENVKGGFTLFPSYVPHRTDVYTNASVPRVSIAFDLRLPGSIDPRFSTMVFMNPLIFNSISKEIDPN